ncbi:hypothetical protein NP493_352g00003 [Ridgeia piscesae]|uniref:Uncharacterized protein n=1 Tax=Ridgeia piscesae TaxID=27915 RepID=A0AAD9NVI9_RIDPI|nr:hypothetical protein NP493_352g00003 [Ridgeia piscesae]
MYCSSNLSKKQLCAFNRSRSGRTLHALHIFKTRICSERQDSPFRRCLQFRQVAATVAAMVTIYLVTRCVQLCINNDRRCCVLQPCQATWKALSQSNRGPNLSQKHTRWLCPERSSRIW